MEINEIKIGDLVSFKNKNGKMSQGKVIHRHDGKANDLLAGHLNVQPTTGKRFPITIHASKLKPVVNEDKKMDSIKEALQDLLDNVMQGSHLEANEIFDAVMQDRIEKLLDDTKPVLAAALFSPENCCEEDVMESKKEKDEDEDEDEDEEDDEDEKENGKLKGKQHKIDMNKNGKLDAHDFKMLRAKKGMKEEVELDEGNAENKMKKNAFVQKLGHKVSSFSTQKAHMQSGRNALKNKPTGYHNEEVEQVDELSKQTLSAYIKKAGPQIGDLENKHGIGSKSAMKRRGGVTRASINYLKKDLAGVKEEFESLDELNKSTLQSYADKVGGSRGGNDGGQLGGLAKKAHAEVKSGNTAAAQKTAQKFVKREKGLKTAVDKLHQKRFQEEVEQIDELSKKTLKSYVKKATTSAARNWAKGEKEEDKSMSTDGNKYPAKQERHMKNAGAAYNTASKREKGIKTAQQKLQSQKEAYSDPYAAKKAAEMKKGQSDAIAAAKKEFEASKESKGKISAKKVFPKLKEEIINEISRFKEREIAHELRHEDEYERKHKRPYVAPARRPVSEPHAVHIGGKKWKSFGSHAHASAIAKKLEAKGKKATVHKEEVEQIDELSKQTLGSYVKKASGDLLGKGAQLALSSGRSSGSVGHKVGKRIKGLYRASDKMVEEIEQMDEVITKATPTAKIIKDFVHSKNPKFAGKSKKERIRMALGAKYAMMRNEEIELDEGNAENKAKKNAHISATADDKLKQSRRASAAANPGLTKRAKYRLAQGNSGDDLVRTREKHRKNS